MQEGAVGAVWRQVLQRMKKVVLEDGERGEDLEIQFVSSFIASCTRLQCSDRLESYSGIELGQGQKWRGGIGLGTKSEETVQTINQILC